MQRLCAETWFCAIIDSDLNFETVSKSGSKLDHISPDLKGLVSCESKDRVQNLSLSAVLQSTGWSLTKIHPGFVR